MPLSGCFISEKDQQSNDLLDGSIHNNLLRLLKQAAITFPLGNLRGKHNITLNDDGSVVAINLLVENNQTGEVKGEWWHVTLNEIDWNDIPGEFQRMAETIARCRAEPKTG